MIIGCYVSFFVSHQQICIELLQKGKKTQVVVAGKSNKNKIGMENKVKLLAKRLERMDMSPSTGKKQGEIG